MSVLYYLSIALFASAIANDWLLARQIRKAVEAKRMNCPDLEDARFGGSPLGIVFNLFRFRKIPATHDLSDPDHIAIRRHYRVHHALVGLLAACIAAGFLLRLTA